MEESYALLDEGLREFLSRRDLQLEPKEIDYLEGILEKIHFSISITDNEEDKERLQELKKQAWALILTQFNKDYDGIADMSALTVDSTADLRFVYYFFYYNRRSNIRDIIVGRIVDDRKTLSQQYKKETKKDFMLNRLRDELPGFKNQAHYNVITFYQEIVEELLGSGEFLDAVKHLPMNFDQMELLNVMFENMDQATAYSRYVEGLTEHDDYTNFLIEVRDELIDKLREMN
jgi:hypothetical protein